VLCCAVFAIQKYEVGSHDYDTRPDKKLRAPAWCDRILWRAQDVDDVKLLSYHRAELLMSDHKPVAAVLNTQVHQHYDDIC
jgi:inositol polyphosphate 5-phosphatase INPP5B/F